MILYMMRDSHGCGYYWRGEYCCLPGIKRILGKNFRRKTLKVRVEATRFKGSTKLRRGPLCSVYNYRIGELTLPFSYYGTIYVGVVE